jgi:uncharacterized protein (TIGR00661 family)
MSNKKPNILVAALDWGLGHATRLMPIIEELKINGCNIILASSGNALHYWKQEFSDNTIIELPAYNPVYHAHGNMNLSMALQAPKFLHTIYVENQLLKKIVLEYSIDGVISDNRYGLFHSNIPCVIITHQLFIQTPRHLNFLKPVIEKINFSFINRFSQCWVPDFEDENNISGILSHSVTKLANTKYIGILSRLKKENTTIKYDVLVLLSGPEPQRTVLENILLKQLQPLKKNILLVRGNNSVPELKNIPTHIKVMPLLTSSELNTVINQSAFVVCRSGYSTIMDLVTTAKPALLVPTPGQTEQLYLAELMKDKGWFNAQLQPKINLHEALLNKDQYKPALNQHTTELLSNTVIEFIREVCR